MLTNEQIMEYYENHRADYPVVFSAIDNGIVMWSDAKETESIAYLEDNAYQIYPGNLMPYVYIRGLQEDAESHHLEYDEDDPQLVLDAFIDCVYLLLNRLKRDVEDLMEAIEGRK